MEGRIYVVEEGGTGQDGDFERRAEAGNRDRELKGEIREALVGNWVASPDGHRF